MEITVSEISTSSGLREFIHLPSKIHAGSRYFIAPFYRDEFKFHDEAGNASLQQSEVIRLIAYKNGVASGRIMGIVFHPWNRRTGLTDARFFQFDFINDPDVASALLNAVEQWAKSKGMNRLVGPFGFSDKDPQGLQTEGFEFDPVIAAATNEPYLPQLIERLGFEKFKDCVSYRLDIPDTLPELHIRAAKRLHSRSDLNTLSFDSRKSLKPWIVPVMRLMNDAYKDIYGFMPLTDNEIQALAEQYLPLLDPKLVKVIADNENQPAAFIIAMPNISKGLKRAAGRLFPFGWIHILLAMRNASRLDLLLGGIADQYKGRGLSTLLGMAVFEEAKRKGLCYLDSHLILEENRLMRAEIENLGGTIYKRYRIYSKLIP